MKNVPFVLEKSVFSAAIGWNVLYMSVKFIWSKVLFKSSASLLISGLDDLSIVDSGVLKSITFIVLSSDLLVCAKYI